AGAGLVVAPSGGPADGMGVLGPDDGARIRTAVETVLGDRSHRAAAERLAAEMGAMPTADGLLDTLTVELGIAHG
ncbi:hypothetical protein, partial [Streptomyces sp. SID3343]